jgi:hypothetical protein
MEKLLAKISKLQAMADRGTRQEAQIAAGKISSLLLKHNLTLSDLASFQTATLSEVDLEVGSHRWEQHLAAAVARAHLCGAIASIEEGQPTVFRFIGRQDNVAVAIQVFHWLDELVLKMSNDALVGMRDHRADWYVFIDPVGWKFAYQCGMVDGITEAFRRARAALDPHEETALVPLDKEVEDHIRDNYAEARAPTIRDEMDARAYRAGYTAGLLVPTETQIDERDPDDALTAGQSPARSNPTRLAAQRDHGRD